MRSLPILALCGALASLAACDAAPSGSPAPQAAAPAARPPAQVGEASYYAPEFVGKETASGEPLRADAMTAASRTLPLGADAKVTNTETGKSVTVEVNDRGPYVDGRILDVSPKAAKHLGMKSDGVAKVVVQPLEPAPPR